MLKGQTTNRPGPEIERAKNDISPEIAAPPILPEAPREIEHLAERAEISACEVETSGLPVAEKIAITHQAEVPARVRSRLQEIATLAKKALAELKRGIFDQPNFDKPNSEAGQKERHLEQLKQQLRDLLAKPTETEFGYLEISAAQESMRELARADKRAEAIVDNKNGHPYVRLKLYEAVGEVTAEKDPLATLNTTGRKAWQLYRRYSKEIKDKTFFPEDYDYDRFRWNWAAEGFLIHKISTPDNAEQILSAAETGALPFSLSSYDKRLLYSQALHRAVKFGDQPRSGALVEKIHAGRERSAKIWTKHSAEDQKVIRIVTDLFLRTAKQRLQTDAAGTAKQAYAFLTYGFEGQASSFDGYIKPKYHAFGGEADLTLEQLEQIEQVAARAAEKLKPEELLRLAREANLFAKDFILEDWAMRAVNDDLDEVLAVIKKEYGESDAIYENEPPIYREQYQARLLVKLLGAADTGGPAVRKLMQAIEATASKLEEDVQTFIIKTLRNDARLSRDPENACRVIDRFPGLLPLLDESAYARQLLRVNPAEGIKRVMRILDDNEANEAKANRLIGQRYDYDEILDTLIEAVAIQSPANAIIVLENHVPSHHRFNFLLITKHIPRDRLADFIIWLDKRGRPKITLGAIKTIEIHQKNQFLAVAERIAEMSPPAAEIILNSHDVFSPLEMWRLVRRAPSAIKTIFFGVLANKFGAGGGPELIESILEHPKLTEIKARYDSQYAKFSEALLFIALRSPLLADDIFSAAAQLRARNQDIEPNSIVSFLKQHPDHAREAVDLLPDRRFKHIQHWWGDFDSKVLNKILESYDNKDAVLSFFDEPSVLPAIRENLGDDKFRWLISVFINSKNIYDADRQAEFLVTARSPQLPRLISAFPRYAPELYSQIADRPAAASALFERTAELADQVDLLAEVCVFDNRAFRQQFKAGEQPFNEAELVRLGEKMTARGLSWNLIADIPFADWSNARQALEQRATAMPGEFSGGAVVAKSLVRSLRTRESLAASRQHISNLEGRIRWWENQLNIIGSALSAGEQITPDHPFALVCSANLNAIVGAQELIANKHLRTRMQDQYFESGGLIPAELLAQLPERMQASLALLAHQYKLTPAELTRLGETMYAGKVLKKSTDADRFNYFLLEGANQSQAVRDFFQAAILLMELANNAKKQIFELTQLARSFQAIEGRVGRGAETQASFNRVSVFLQNIADQAQRLRPPEIKNKMEAARVKASQEKFVTESLGTGLISFSGELVKMFQKQSGVELSTEETRRFLEQFKDPQIIFIYLSKLAEYPRQKQLFQRFISAVAKGNLAEARYSLNRVHLDKVFAGREEAEMIWRKNFSLQDIIGRPESGEASVKQRIDNLLDAALINRHLPAGVHALAQEFAVGNPAEKEKILARTKTEIAYLRLAIKLAVPITDEKTLKMQAGIRKSLGADGQREVSYIEQAYSVTGMPPVEVSLQNMESALRLMYLLQAKPDELSRGELLIAKENGKEKKIKLTELLAALKSQFPNEADAFYNDLAGIEQIIALPPAGPDAGAGETSALTVEESEDPDLMLRLGTDVVGSCQNINGTPSLNRNLVSYLMDGKVKVLLVRDAEGSLLARSLLRILYDEAADRPVVHLEQDYHASNSPVNTARERLILLAKAKARALGFPLVVSGRFNSSSTGLKIAPYPNALVSYGGPGQVEYVDNLGNNPPDGQPEQRYTIPAGMFSPVEV